MHQQLRRHDPQTVPVPQTQAGLPSITLEIIRGRARNHHRSILRTPYFIGAGDDCDMVLSDPQFADVHAYVIVKRDSVSIRHLGFDPELTVDGRPARRAVLSDQSVIKMGPYQFRVHFQNAMVAVDEPDQAESNVRRLLDEVAQNKLPEPSGPKLGVYSDCDDDCPAQRPGELLSIGVPHARMPLPTWQHLSWRK